MAVASSGALDSAPAVTTELSLCRGLDAPGAGPLICSAWAGASLLSWAILASAWAGRSLDPGVCPRCPVLPGLRCWIRALGRAAPSPQTRSPSSSDLLRGQAVHMLQPFRELVPLSTWRRCLLVSQGA